MTPTPPRILDEDVRRALAEDVGAGDLTAQLLPEGAEARAEVVTREAMVLCGRPWFDAVFQQLDARISITWEVAEATGVAADTRLCTLKGPARALVTGERTALNFLQLLSGVATETRRYVEVVQHTPVRLLDSRKTIPGLRAAQKYAVACGGGHNHRMGLFDAVLIKENHIAAAGGIGAALAAARVLAPQAAFIEIEVESLEELHAALAGGATRILLDNFTVPDLRAAVAAAAGRARLEASGGITLENLRAVAETGVDDISLGGLTKHVRAIDLSLRVA